MATIKKKFINQMIKIMSKVEKNSICMTTGATILYQNKIPTRERAAIYGIVHVSEFRCGDKKQTTRHKPNDLKQT